MKTSTKTFYFSFLLFAIFSSKALAYTFSWSGYTTGSDLLSPYTYTTGMMSATVTNTTWQTAGTYPKYTTTASTGLHVNVNWANLTSTVTITINFSSPYKVVNPSFTIYDINANSNSALTSNMFIDVVTITGTNSSNAAVTPTITGPSTAATISGNTLTGITGSLGVGAQLNNVSFSGTMKQIVIVYSSGPTLYVDPTSPYTDAGMVAQATTNPRDQQITIGDISYGVLPIELADFNLECLSEKVRISWITKSEINNNYFEIEQSLDGKNYNTIQQISGAGTSSSASRYEILINANNNGNYYRLKQTDFDGKTESFAPKYLACNSQEITNSISINLFPNPANQVLNINVSQNEDIEENTILIYDALGRKITEKKLYDLKDISIDISQFDTGNYYLQLLQNNTLTTKSFVKL